MKFDKRISTKTVKIESKDILNTLVDHCPSYASVKNWITTSKEHLNFVHFLLKLETDPEGQILCPPPQILMLFMS